MATPARDGAGLGGGGTMLRGLMRRYRQLSGIYGTGFNPDSVLGVVLPVAFVALVGGLGALLVVILD